MAQQIQNLINVVLPKSPTTPSLRDLARELGILHTTVAQALRDNPKVKLATRERVKTAARKIGYQINPLASMVMAGMRMKSGDARRGTVGIVDLDGPEKRTPAGADYLHELTEGARRRSLELGFRSEIFSLAQHTSMSVGRMLQARGVLGALILPARDAQTIAHFDWSRYAVVYCSYSDGQPPLHNIFSDHFRAMEMALTRMHELAYRHIGIVLDQPATRRMGYRWSNVLSQSECNCNQKHMPVLVMPELKKAKFASWFLEHNPDVVIADNTEVMQWMIRQGACIPETHGFCCLNIAKKSDFMCAGVNQQPRAIGTRAIEQVVAQMQRGEYGIPAQPMSMTISPRWNEGSTLRAASIAPVPTKRAALVAA